MVSVPHLPLLLDITYPVVNRRDELHLAWPRKPLLVVEADEARLKATGPKPRITEACEQSAEEREREGVGK